MIDVVGRNHAIDGGSSHHLTHLSARNRMRANTAALFIGMAALSGCYHATIDTGVAPSHVVIQKRWASGWIFGLVAPSTTATAAQCPSGVAKVETKLSFLNGLVSTLTMSIYTPMTVRVTCAEGSATAAAPMMVPDSVSTDSGQVSAGGSAGGAAAGEAADHPPVKQ
jgi:Bor protein